jgi:metallo-beta-lactamase class B
MRIPILFGLLLLMLVLPVRAQEKIELDRDVEMYTLAPGIWRHVTYKAMEGWGNVPANGLIVASDGHAAMIDTPWTPGQTAVLLDWVEKVLKAKVEIIIVGHSHVDCLGGLPEIHRRGIVSVGLDKTRELALAAKVEAPRETFTKTRKLLVGTRELELFFPGAGHTVDNIVTWIADEKVLFGGCLVKAASAASLGYIREADLAAWPFSLKMLKERFPETRWIVPGHGDPGGWELVEHTLKLLAEKTD